MNIKEELRRVAQSHDKSGEPSTARLLRKSADRISELENIIRAILDGDEHGQGVLWQEAMDAAHKTINAK